VSTTPSVFQPGTYHVSNPTSKATYSNRDVLTINPSTTQNAIIVADAVGPAGNASSNTITQPVTSLVGVTITNPNALTGSNYETNVALAARCRLKLGALSPNGPKAAYAFVALSATQAPFNVTFTHGPITRVLVSPSTGTGTVAVIVANASGAVLGVVGASISAATNASPIVVTITATAGLSNGDIVTVSGAEGNSAANGTWTIAGLTPTTFQLFALDGVTPSVGNGVYTTGGVAEAGDLGQVDNAIQNFAVPDSVTAIAQSATTRAVTFAVTVYVPSAYAGVVTAAVQAAITNYLATVPIGGVTLAAPNQLPFDAVLGAIFEGAPYIKQATMLMGGGTSDITLNPTDVPIVSGAIAVTVNAL
jgi:hypothetical protein